MVKFPVYQRRGALTPGGPLAAMSAIFLFGPIGQCLDAPEHIGPGDPLVPPPARAYWCPLAARVDLGPLTYGSGCEVWWRIGYP